MTSKTDSQNVKRTVSRSRGKGTTRGVGYYVSQACNICRHKKIKCNGLRPVCGPCESSGRFDECTWGRETVRKPRTEAHFEALRKRSDALEEYANRLETLLEKCKREHGGLSDNGNSYLQFRPLESDVVLPDDQDIIYDDDMGSDAGDDVVQELCLPTRNLVLEDRDLLFYGRNSIFIFAPPPQVAHHASRFPEIAENSRECCVLMVEGVDESCYNPNFDWSRHLPAAVPLDRREHDKVLDLLFKFFTSWCLRIVPALFLRDMWRALSGPRSQTPPKTPHYSPMLHNALVALATAFSDDPRIRDIKARQYFANAAKKDIEDECQKPNISVVHALSVLASFHSSQGDQTLGYMYFGMSARISQALGLSIDCSTWVSSGLISHDDMLDRNWAHWTTFSQDVCWSLYVGRDFCVPTPLDHQRLPVPFVDSEFDQMEWHYPPSKIEPQPNFLSKTFAASCELLAIARHIMEVVNSANSPGTRQEVSLELISKIDLQLNNWKEKLSPEVDITKATLSTSTPHRIMTHLAYWWLFILLHRPFYRRPRPINSSDKDIDHVKLCNRASEHIMELLDAWNSLYGVRYAPITLIQVVFASGTVCLLSAVQAASGLRVGHGSLKHFLSQGELCIKYLLECGKSWQCATNIAEILRNLLQRELHPILARRSLDQGQVLSHNPLISPKPVRKPATKPRSKSSASIDSQVSHSPSSSPTSSTLLQVPQPLAPAHHNHTWEYNSNPTFIVTDGSWSYADAATHSGSLGMGVTAVGSSGMLGIPGGEMIPEVPFMPYGMLDPSQAYLNPLDLADQETSPTTDIGDNDLAVLQQFLRDQSGGVHDLFLPHA